MGLPIISNIIEAIGGAVDTVSDKIWSDANEREKNKTLIKTAILENALTKDKWLMQDLENARELYREELRVNNTPKWARSVQILARPFVMYSCVGMYVTNKLLPLITSVIAEVWNETVTITPIEMSNHDYYLLGSIFIFLFGARSLEKLKGKA